MLTSETISTFLAGQKAVLLLTLFVNIWGLIALYRNTRGRPSDYGLMIMLLGLLGWTGSILTLLVFSALPAAHLAFFSTTVALTGFAWFSLVYPTETYKKYYFIFLIPGITVAVCALIPKFFINGLTADAYGYLSLIRNRALIGFSLYTLFAGLLPSYILFQKRRFEQNVQIRQRLSWIAIASLITFTGSFATNVFLPNFLSFPYLNSVGPAFSMILATIIVWITSVEHYVDTRNVFSIITGRLALVAATIIVYYSVSLLLALGSPEHYVIHIIAAFTTALTIFILGPSIRQFGESILQQKDRRNEASEDTHGLAAALAHTTSVNEIVHILGEILEDSMKTETTEIILAEKISEKAAVHAAALAEIRTCTLNPPTTYLIDALSVTMPSETDPHRIAVAALAKELGARVIVPITHNHQIIGILALGNKKNGRGYTRHDAQVLTSCARVLSPLLIRASIIDHADEAARSLEENITFRTNMIMRSLEEERDIAYKLALKIAAPIEVLHHTNDLDGRTSEDKLRIVGHILDKITQPAQGLLNYTRAKSAPYTSSRIFNLSTIAYELIKNSQKIASESHVALRHEITDNIMVRGNATSIHNALASIIGNAFHYIGGGKKEITITLHSNKDQAIFTVQDTGIGIPGDMLDRIGTPFFHAHPKEVEQGVGLGLAVVKNVITQHEGAVFFSSINGKGTSVRIALPLAIEQY